MSKTKLLLRKERCANTGKHTVLCEQEKMMISRWLSDSSSVLIGDPYVLTVHLPSGFRLDDA